MNLTSEEFGKLFRTFRKSAFRLEALPVYTIADEAEEFEAFRTGGLLPERSMRTSSWLQNVARTTAEGKLWRRVHFVRSPHTDYLEFELVGLEANVAAGEDVRIASLDQHPELEDLCEDFWLFDAEFNHAFVVWMRYDSDGHIRARERSTDRRDLERCREERDRALAVSVALYEYRATTNLIPAHHG